MTDNTRNALLDKDMRWIIAILCAILGVFGFIIYILMHLIWAVMP